MPRPGQVKPPAGERLPDRIAIGLLTVTFPAELVDRVVAETGRVQRRSRLLLARVGVYYVLAMCLFFGQGYEEVARLLTEGLAYARRWRGTWRVPTTAAITRARARLGPEPLRALFAAVCTPMATETTAGAFYRGWRLVAVDGTTFDVPDSVANVGYFGRPGSPRGEGAGAFPQVRVAGLGECGTHAIFAAEMGPLAVHETELARRLLGHLRTGMLLIADRGFTGFDLWRAAAATGADLLWRVKNAAVLPVVEQLADGSYLSHIYAARDKHRHADPITVRVVEYTLAGQATVYRLITTILDPAQPPTPTASPSPAPCGWSAARSPPRRPFPPSRLARALTQALAEIQRHLLTRRLRSNSRVINRKMSNWKLTLAGHRSPRQPSRQPTGTITIAAATKTGAARRQKKQPLQPLSQRYCL